MAPLYDVMTDDIYPDVTRNLAMKIAGKNRGHYIYARHWDRMAEENQLSGAQVRRRVAELSQAVLDALPSVVEELNALKKSPAYQKISDYIAGYCRDMLRNLKSDARDEPEEDPDHEAATRPPGFS
ncbi:serine/threonine-protein kinase HipA [Bradyrhizobium sp. Rc2d]|nr:serine/threonine-protein kinase HipA [Bradyrhizobium sp. Rc2d]